MAKVCCRSPQNVVGGGWASAIDPADWVRAWFFARAQVSSVTFASGSADARVELAANLNRLRARRDQARAQEPKAEPVTR